MAFGKSSGGAHAKGGAHAAPNRAQAPSRAQASDSAPVPNREAAPPSQPLTRAQIQAAKAAAQAPQRAQSSDRGQPRRRTAPPPRPSRNAGLIKGLLAGFLGLGLIALAVIFFLFGVFRVRYILPDGKSKTELVLRGHEADNAPEAVLAGYTFTGWTGSGEDRVALEETPIYENTVLTARMMPALDDSGHKPYLTPDEGGFIRPDALLLRSEAAQIIASFITVSVPVSDNFPDVDADAPYARATALLKALDVVEGTHFRPEEPATLRELVDILTEFVPVLDWADLAVYPEGADPEDPDAAYALLYRFADVSQLDPDYARFCTAASLGWIDYGPEVDLDANHAITRAQAAAFFNRVLGRGQGMTVTQAQAGQLIDLAPTHPLYTDVMEAAVPHTAAVSDGGETWQSAQAFTVDVEPGLFFIGTQMYCMGEDGYLVLDGEAEGFTFGPDGKFTSGMPELDELVQQVLGEIIEPGMTDMEKLRAAYDYTVYNFSYLKGSHYQRGDTSWAAEEAYVMLSTGRNNCYGFAGVFYELARAMGQDATLISGFYGDNYLYHAWVEFTVDGERRICDPEVEWTYLDNPELEKPDMFMMTTAYAKRWRYTP